MSVEKMSDNIIKYAIGIDIGTTGICGVLLDIETGKMKRTISKENDSFIKTENPWEKIQDVSKIEKIAFDILEKLFEEANENVASIGISNQMHGILYLDQNGECISPLFTWQDERGNLPFKNVTYAEHLGSHSGYGLVTDFYNRENGLVPKNAACCCTIGDYFAMKLCAAEKPLMHITNAASFGCFDIEKNEFTLDNGILPDITTNFCVIGQYRGAKVTVAIGDNQASVIGSVKGEMPLVNFGTGSQVSYFSRKVIKGENIESRPFDGKKYLVVGSALCGGRAFALLERFFASVVELATGEECPSLYEQIDKTLEAKTKTDMKADSRFCGTRSDTNIKGGFYDITEKNFNASDMALSLLYAMANELKAMYSGKKSEYIVCSGNGIRKNKALQRVVSEVFGSKLKFPKHTEEAAFGAALVSLAGCGAYNSIDQASELIIYYK